MSQFLTLHLHVFVILYHMYKKFHYIEIVHYVNILGFKEKQVENRPFWCDVHDSQKDIFEDRQS